MQGRVSGLLMTMLMALPLAGIALMTIFGVPQVGTLASALDPDVGFLGENPNPKSDWDSAPAFSSSGSENETMLGTGSSRTGSENTSAFASGSSSLENEALTWEQGLQKLSQMGIQNYRLQPGYEPNTFHFACYLQPSQGINAPVIRFESEASTPRLAVQRTLEQVRKWIQ